MKNNKKAMKLAKKNTNFVTIIIITAENTGGGRASRTMRMLRDRGEGSGKAQNCVI